MIQCSDNTWATTSYCDGSDLAIMAQR